MKCQAFVYYAPGDVRLETREIFCGPNDLLVKVQMCGRCGTDRTIFRKGHPKVDPHAPIVLGHELVGEIVEVGSNVRNLNQGIGYQQGKVLSQDYLDFRASQRITLQARIARYRNGLMLLQDPITILSFYIDGGYSQYLRVPEELIRSGSVLRVPEVISDEAAALVEPAACALESIFCTPHPVGVDQEGRHQYRAGILPDGRVGIIGSGTVSLIYAKLAQIEGASSVFVFVRSQEKEALVKRILGDQVICVNVSGKPHQEIVNELADRTSGHLLDDAVAACSDPDAQKLILELCSPQGYAVGACFGGAHQKVDEINLDSLHYRTAKTIGSSGCSTRSMETIIQWLVAGKLSLNGFSSGQVWTLHHPPKDFFTTKGDGLKPMLRPWE